MNFEALRDLIQTHPDYPTVSDEDLMTWLHAEVIERTRETINSDEMYELIDASEWSNLTADQKDEVWNMLLLFSSSGIPTTEGTRARTRFIQIFGAGSATITAVVGAISYQVSRLAASDVGSDEVSIGEVAHARTL